MAHVADAKTGWGSPATGLSLQGEFYAWTVLRHHPEAFEIILRLHPPEGVGPEGTPAVS